MVDIRSLELGFWSGLSLGGPSFGLSFLSGLSWLGLSLPSIFFLISLISCSSCLMVDCERELFCLATSFTWLSILTNLFSNWLFLVLSDKLLSSCFKRINWVCNCWICCWELVFSLF